MLKFQRTALCQMICLCVLVLFPFAAWAVGTVSVTQGASSNVFNLVASGLDAPAGFDVTLSFDGTRLSNPRVALGSAASGALLVANTTLPGAVRIALVKHPGMKGNGTIATVTFDKLGDSAGAIAITKGSVISESSRELSPSFIGWTPSSSDVGLSSTDTNPSAASGTGTGTTQTTPTVNPVVTSSGGSTPYVVGGTLTMPSDDFGNPRKEAAGQPGQPQPQPLPPEPRENVAPAPADAEVAAEAPPAAKKVEKELPPVQSVLEKFRLFAGERTPKNLLALFEAEPGASYSQLPPVCIADGKASVQLIVSKVAGDKAPHFSFSHASFLSLQHTGSGEWQVVVKPEKGALKASVSVLANGTPQEIPLSVSPAADVDLDKSGTVTGADFLLFLKTRGTEGAPKFDLNGDGKRDYQDDYIFSANYLAAKAVKEKKEVPVPKKGQ